MRDYNIDRSYFIECALTSGQQLFLLGWIDDTDTPLSRVTVEGLDGQRRSYSLDGPYADGKCLRTPRPDVHKSLRLSSQPSSRLGFVIALPEQLADGARAIVSFDGFEQSAQLSRRSRRSALRPRCQACWSTPATRCANWRLNCTPTA